MLGVWLFKGLYLSLGEIAFLVPPIPINSAYFCERSSWLDLCCNLSQKPGIHQLLSPVPCLPKTHGTKAKKTVAASNRALSKPDHRKLLS